MPKAVAQAEQDELDDLDDELEAEAEAEVEQPPPRKAPPVAQPVKPIRVAPPEEDDSPSAVDFDKEAKKRRDAQKVNDFLERKKSEETTSVDTIEDLMLEGDADKILRELVPYCADNTGIKKAKQLLREARDRAKARVTRIAGTVGVMLDELKEEDDSGNDHH